MSLLSLFIYLPVITVSLQMGPYTEMIAGIIMVCGCLSRGFFCQSINLEAKNTTASTLPFLCPPHQGQEQVHNCFEWPNRFSTIVSAQQNISRDSRAKFTFPDTRLCQRYRRLRFSSLSSLDGFSRCSAQLAAHLREMKCKYGRKVCFFFFPAAAAEQSTLRIFLRLDSPLRPR